MLEKNLVELYHTPGKQYDESKLYVYLSRVSMESLVSQVLSDEKLKPMLKFNSFTMKVEDLDDYIEGYMNVFDEELKVDVTPVIEEIQQDGIMFEEDFETISLTCTLRLDFSHPMHEDYLSAQVFLIARIQLIPFITSSYDMAFRMSSEQIKVKQVNPFFLSETTNAEFQKTFKKVLGKQTEKIIAQKLMQGFELPIGWQSDTHINGDSDIIIHKDMLVIKKEKVNYTPILTFSRFDSS